MKKFLVFLLIPLFSFSQEQLTGEKIIDHINEFFSALNIKNYNKELLRQKVTSDFIIFEMGERFSLDEFTNFIESSGFLEWESTNWVLSDFTSDEKKQWLDDTIIYVSEMIVSLIKNQSDFCDKNV